MDRSSLWLFETSPYRAASKGPPSSPAQHDAIRVFLTQALPGVAAHDAAHGRVRLERGAVNRDRLAPEQARRHQPLLHPRGEDGAVALEVDDASRPGSRRMIWRWLVHRQPQKSAHRQRVAGAPSDPADPSQETAEIVELTSIRK